MSATLRMTREGFGIELRRGRFEIYVNGDGVGSSNATKRSNPGRAGASQPTNAGRPVLQPRSHVRRGGWRSRQLPHTRHDDLATVRGVHRQAGPSDLAQARVGGTRQPPPWAPSCPAVSSANHLDGRHTEATAQRQKTLRMRDGPCERSLRRPGGGSGSIDVRTRRRSRRPWSRPSRPSALEPSGRSSTGSCGR